MYNNRTSTSRFTLWDSLSFFFLHKKSPASDDLSVLFINVVVPRATENDQVASLWTLETRPVLSTNYYYQGFSFPGSTTSTLMIEYVRSCSDTAILSKPRLIHGLEENFATKLLPILEPWSNSLSR